jgi:electron-transferring-flavoprotein dehydrogenase
MTPGQFPPPPTSETFIAPKTALPENRIDVGILFVGAGPANLAAAIRLMQFLNENPAIKNRLGEIPVALVEKGKYVGAHLLAGAVMNPVSLRRLFPHLPVGQFPLDVPVDQEALYFLTEQKAIPLPMIPTLHNQGNFAVSLSRLGQWLAQEAEQLGITIFTETPARRLLVEKGVICGIRTGDKGVDRSGNPLPNFQEGVEIVAQATILGEGGQGHLTQAALAHFGIKRLNPQTYSLGIKEVWEVRQPLHQVIHTLGWPLRGDRDYGEFGGSFLYPMGANKISIGLVVGLGYRDATLSVHHLFQQMKSHRFFKTILEGGERIAWGAKTIPEGGYYAVPESLALPGGLIVGDGAGLLNVPAIKGIHYAMGSGILAAETLATALKEGRNLSAQETLSAYDRAVRDSFIMRDLYSVRNMRQAFDYGFTSGVLLAGLMTLTGGRFPGWRFETKPDKETSLWVGSRSQPKLSAPFDKLSSVHLSGNKSRDDQPNHIGLETQVPETVGTAWINMCPANVYEWASGSEGEERGRRLLRINPTNCVQCGAIAARGGRLTPPEGGSGPEYKDT